VTIVTGFLGAGKTTLVNYILQGEHGKTIAVIENEFGEVSIDEALVAENMQFKEDIITMSNGCAGGDGCVRCCTTAAGCDCGAAACRALRLACGAGSVPGLCADKAVCVLICASPCRPRPQVCLLQHTRRLGQGAHGACGAGEALRPRPNRDDGPGGPSTCRAGACRAAAQERLGTHYVNTDCCRWRRACSRRQNTRCCRT
jgi:hypothetical protein